MRDESEQDEDSVLGKHSRLDLVVIGADLILFCLICQFRECLVHRYELTHLWSDHLFRLPGLPWS